MPGKIQDKRRIGERVMTYSREQYNRGQDRILISGGVMILAGFFITGIPVYKSNDSINARVQESAQRKDQSKDYLRTMGTALIGLGALGSIGLMHRNEQRYKQDMSDKIQ